MISNDTIPHLYALFWVGYSFKPVPSFLFGQSADHLEASADQITPRGQCEPWQQLLAL